MVKAIPTVNITYNINGSFLDNRLFLIQNRYMCFELKSTHYFKKQ
jgi:hypothetical protein